MRQKKDKRETIKWWICINHSSPLSDLIILNTHRMEKVNQINGKASSIHERKWSESKSVWWVDVVCACECVPPNQPWWKSIYFYFLLTQNKQSSPWNGNFSMIHQLESNVRGWNAKQMCVMLCFFRMLLWLYCECFYSENSRRKKIGRKMRRSIFSKRCSCSSSTSTHTHSDRPICSPPPRKNVAFFVHSGTSTTIYRFCVFLRRFFLFIYLFI